MKLSRFVILLVLAVAMSSCYKDEESSPEYLKKIKSFGGDSTYIATNGMDTEDGLFITGRAVISDNNEDIFMLKMDDQGNRL